MSLDPARSAKADTLFDAFLAAAIGGGTIALFFLVVDLIRGQPLLTPSVLGHAVFTGEPYARTVSLEMVALFSVVHFALFGLFGAVASAALHRLDHSADHAVLVTLALFVVLEVGVLTAEIFVAPGVVQALGFVWVTLANMLTAGSMAWFLKRSHRVCEHNEKSLFAFGTPAEATG